jgi:hypothetical protein
MVIGIVNTLSPGQRGRFKWFGLANILNIPLTERVNVANGDRRERTLLSPHFSLLELKCKDTTPDRGLSIGSC